MRLYSLQLVLMCHGPFAQQSDGLVNTLAQLGQAVLGFGRYDAVDLTVNESVLLEPTQSLDEHLLGDVGKLPLQLPEAPGTL